MTKELKQHIKKVGNKYKIINLRDDSLFEVGQIVTLREIKKDKISAYGDGYILDYLYDVDSLRPEVEEYVEYLELPTAIELMEYFKDTHIHIINVQRFITGAIMDLQSRAFEHDISKYSPEELLIYAKVTPMFKGLTYGTKEHKAVGDLLGPAWEHHQRVNDHHTGFHKKGINDMNLMSIIEMLCDWKAASMRDPNQDFKKSCSFNCDKYGANEQLRNIIMNTARDLDFFT